MSLEYEPASKYLRISVPEVPTPAPVAKPTASTPAVTPQASNPTHSRRAKPPPPLGVLTPTPLGVLIPMRSRRANPTHSRRAHDFAQIASTSAVMLLLYYSQA